MAIIRLLFYARSDYYYYYPICYFTCTCICTMICPFSLTPTCIHTKYKHAGYRKKVLLRRQEGPRGREEGFRIFRVSRASSRRAVTSSLSVSRSDDFFYLFYVRVLSLFAANIIRLAKKTCLVECQQHPQPPVKACFYPRTCFTVKTCLKNIKSDEGHRS